MKKIPKTEQKIFDRCEVKNIKYNGINPVIMTIKDLRQCAISIGANIIGDRVDILQSVVDTLSKRPQTSSGTAGITTTTTTSSSNNDGQIDPIAIGERILALAENDDDEGILNLGVNKGGEKITRTTPQNIMRKAYLKLSLIIHPDRLQQWKQATKAFQALVKAFERLSSPDLIAEEKATSSRSRGDSKEKLFQISRSNEGCERTRVFCPKCKVPWNEGTLDGNPDYFYNFLMMGLKSYHCSTCLFQFGAMTAIHRCPFCRATFEYSPSDYHKKVTCPRDKCKKKFGFYMFHASERVIEDLKKSVKEEQEKLLKAKEAKCRRNARGKPSLDDEMAFTLGLIDECPRCGENLDDYEDDAARIHLMDCTDVRKHQEHKKKKIEEALKQEKKNEKQTLQESVQRQAAWELLGSKTNQMWMLDDDQVKNVARIEGLKTKSDSRETLINEMAKKRRLDENVQLIEEKKSSSSALITTNKKKGNTISIQDIPSNFRQLGVSELRSILACHGLLDSVSNSNDKSSLVKVIESNILGENIDDSNEDNDDDDDDDEYVDLVSP